MKRKKDSPGCVIVIVVAIIIAVVAAVRFKPTSSGERVRRALVNAADPQVLERGKAASEKGYQEGRASVLNATPKGEITNAIENRVSSQYTSTDIDRITINEDAGTSSSGDYIALVYLTWNVKNTGKTSKEMLRMYSDDLAATVAKECPSVTEIAVFWTVPYLNDAGAKCAYERSGDSMFLSDAVWDSAFQ